MNGYIHFFKISFVCFFVFCSCFVFAVPQTSKSIEIKIDRNFFENGKIKPLDGTWEYYEGIHLRGREDNKVNTTPVLLEIPLECFDCHLPKTTSDTIKATYRVIIRKPVDFPELSIIIYGLNSKYKLLINGKEVRTSIQFASHEKNKVEGRTREVIQLPDGDYLELRFLFYNVSNQPLTFPYAPLIGYSEHIAQSESLRGAIEMIEIGCILMMSIFNLFLFFQMRQNAYLLISLLCIAVLIRSTLVFDGSALLYQALPFLSISAGRKIEFCLTYSTLFLPPIFVRELFKEHLFGTLTKFLLFVGSILMALSILFSANVFFRVLSIYHLLMIVSFYVVLATLFRAVKRKKIGARTVSIGLSIAITFVSLEILQNSTLLDIQHFGPNLAGTGLVIYLFTQTIAISAIFSKVHKENITLNTQLENKIQERTEQLSKSNLIREQLIGIISHDIKNPMISLKGLFMMLDSQSSNEEIRGQLIAKIKGSFTSTLQLLEELISWSSSQLKYSEEFEVTKTKINVHKLIDDNLELFKESASKKSITLINQSERKIIAQSDEDIAKMILRNLLNNAIKFTRNGGRIGITSTINNDMVIVSVTDTGLGIPDEIKKNLFVPGKATRYGTNDEKGSGLGLVLCKDLAVKNNGDLWLESTEIGHGTTFKFSLPKFT